MSYMISFAAMRNWMNSLGVRPFINSLYHDVNDGIALLMVRTQ